MNRFLQKSEPYQWFFPLGILFGVAGTGVWIGYWLHGILFYPAVIHSEIMIGGFFLTVAIGFLMTAIPKFTGTKSASPLEKLVVLLLIISLSLNAFSLRRIWFHSTLLLEILFVVRFGLSRLLRGTFKPGPSFILVGFGILSALVAISLQLINDLTPLPVPILSFARQLFFYGIFLNLILGIGTQLVPSILGIVKKQQTPIQQPSTPFNQPVIDSRIYLQFLFYGILLLGSFIVEAGLNMQVGRILRALLITGVVLFHWRIYLRPHSPGILGWCLWVSAWMLVIGIWPPVISQTYAVHGAHILFIGALSLMIFSIATRVTLAHGHHDQQAEKRSVALTTMLFLLIIGLLTRLTTPFFPNYFSHLAYAAILWILAAFCWSIQFFPKIFLRRP